MLNTIPPKNMKLISTSLETGRQSDFLENIWISVALIVFYRVLFHVHAYIIINSRCHYQ
jgi:fatty-acid desaturase